jgi:tetratricopeptide (TPR) repeat protein
VIDSVSEAVGSIDEAEYRSGHFSGAEKLLLAALSTIEKTDPAERAATLIGLGDVYLNEDEMSKAERAYSESAAIYRRLSDKSRTALALRNLGILYSRERRDDEALRALRQALQLARVDSAEHVDLMVGVLNGMGMAYFLQGNNSKAENLFKQALKMVSDSGVSFDTSEPLNNLGAVYLAKHQFQKAEDFLQQALKITEMSAGPFHPDLTFTLTALGALYAETERYAAAEEQYQRALTILEPDELALETRIARVLYGLSAVYIKAGRKDEGENALLRAAAIARNNLSQSADMAAILEDYSAMLRKQGKTEDAEELRVEARRARVSNGLVTSAHNPF